MTTDQPGLSKLEKLNALLGNNTRRPTAPTPAATRQGGSLKPPTTSPANVPLFPSPNSAQRALSSLAPPRGRERKKVALKPGHSPLDWAQLNRTEPKFKLRGVDPNTPPPQFVKIKKEELKKHKSQDDCWTCINGRVYNITPYVDFHPGGVEEIMKCAGRDGTALFNKYHSWVNVDRMLENCIVGLYVP